MTLVAFPFGSARAAPLRQAGTYVDWWSIGAATIVAAVDGGISLGKAKADSLGLYELIWKIASAEGATPTTGFGYLQFVISESSPGVFSAGSMQIGQIEGGSATGDATDTAVQSSKPLTQIILNGDLSVDGQLQVGIATAASVANDPGMGTAVGDLYVLNAENTFTQWQRLSRLSSHDLPA